MLTKVKFGVCNKTNKQFKRDSQRSAFLTLLQIKCLWHNALGLGGSVAHPLIGRYVLEGVSSLKVIDFVDSRYAHFFFVVLASYTALASSSEPLLLDVESKVYELLFTELVPVNGVVFNLSIGVVVSYIFYFLVVFLPSYRARKLVSPVLKKREKRISIAIKGMLDDISNSSGVTLKQDLDLKALEEALKRVNSHTKHESFKYSVPRVDGRGGNFVDRDGNLIFEERCYTLGERLAHKWSIIKNDKNELIQLYGLLPTEAVAALDTIDDGGFDFIFIRDGGPVFYSASNIYELYVFSTSFKNAIRRY
ncbi:hypothetical protein [Vibrio aestuarianus]|uniref:hypothetical protein n=1 Tax=Vibrio aestuarianus TaxID=28171 RepID=UPI00237D22F0|nr:hypothetical protein [Vibrio aestuarianus]MDE1266148.1 hypothetical protein [Vibrio aestuarianus]MDE1298349.1 hypothetical protein [Vibrio aestuarianus]